MQLYTKHAPQTWADIVGQDRAVKRVRAIAERDGFDRGAFWIDAAGTNNSGLGKSTIARVLANTLADGFFVQELDGARLDKRAVQELQDFCDDAQIAAGDPDGEDELLGTRELIAELDEIHGDLG